MIATAAPVVPKKLERIQRTDLAKRQKHTYTATLLPGHRVLFGVLNGTFIFDLDKRTSIDTDMRNAWSPHLFAGGTRVVLGDESGFAVLDPKNGKVLKRWKSHEVSELALSVDEKVLATAWWDNDHGTISVWNFNGGAMSVKAKPILSIPVKEMTEWLSISNDGKELAAGDYEACIRVWTLANGKIKWTHKEKAAFGNLGAFGPDGQLASTWGEVVKIRDAKGKLVKQWAGHPKYSTVAVRWLGPNLVTMAEQDAVKIWTPAGKCLAKAKTLKAAIHSPMISIIESMLLTSGPVGLYAIK